MWVEPGFGGSVKRRAPLRAARRKDEFKLIAGRFRRVLQTLQRLINREAAGFLARREFRHSPAEILKVLPIINLRLINNEPMPILITFSWPSRIARLAGCLR